MNRLRHYRLSRDLTQAKLAAKIHMTQNRICELERGNPPWPFEAKVLAGFFEVKPEQLFPDGIRERKGYNNGPESHVTQPRYLPPLPAAPVPAYPREFRVVCPKCGISLCHTTERSRNLMGDDLTCYACGQGYEVNHV